MKSPDDLQVIELEQLLDSLNAQAATNDAGSNTFADLCRTAAEAYDWKCLCIPTEQGGPTPTASDSYIRNHANTPALVRYVLAGFAQFMKEAGPDGLGEGNVSRNTILSNAFGLTGKKGRRAKDTQQDARAGWFIQLLQVAVQAGRIDATSDNATEINRYAAAWREAECKLYEMEHMGATLDRSLDSAFIMRLRTAVKASGCVPPPGLNS